MPFRLVYGSDASVPFDNAGLEELAHKADEKNRSMRVTGYLSFQRRTNAFFQFLEGPREAVLELMEIISKDERHKLFNLVQLGDFPTHLFPRWSMRYVTTDEFRMIEMEDVLEMTLRSMREKVFEPEVIKETTSRIGEKLAAKLAY